MEIKKIELLTVLAEDGMPVLDRSDLSNIAAISAAAVLAENWTYAIRDGASMDSLIPDVDEIVGILRSWQKRLRETYATVTTSDGGSQ